jgi:hypothetical protein
MIEQAGNINELIATLQKILEECGNLPVEDAEGQGYGVRLTILDKEYCETNNKEEAVSLMIGE